MKNPNLYLAPTVISFGKSTLEKRILAILNYKKPTKLTTALSALLAVGIASTGAFTVAPMPEDTVSVPEPLPTVTASEPDPTGEKIMTQREILKNNAIRSNVTKAYELFIDSLPIGEHGFIYPDNYGGAYTDKNGELILQFTTDDFSEYQYLQDEFHYVKFIKVDHSVNYLQSLADKYLEEFGDSDTWYGVTVDVKSNRVMVICDETTIARRANDPNYSLFVFELGSGYLIFD